MAGSKPIRTEFGICQRLESCVVFSCLMLSRRINSLLKFQADFFPRWQKATTKNQTARGSNCVPGDIEEKVEEQPPPYSLIPEESSTKTEGDVSTEENRKVPKPDFGKKPIKMTCNYCHEEVKTKTVSSVGAAAWAASGAIAACAFVCTCLCLPLLCVCVPCCIPSFRDTTHYCPNCGQILGRHNATRKMFD